MYKYIKVLIISMILLFPVKTVFAEELTRASDVQKMMEKNHQEMMKMQQQELEMLKKTNPELYQQRKDSLDRAAKIQDIISSFQQKTISVSQAEKQLFPLVKKNMQGQIDNLDKSIERLEKKLKSLKEARLNPNSLVQKKIDQMLGKSGFLPEDAMDY